MKCAMHDCLLMLVVLLDKQSSELAPFTPSYKHSFALILGHLFDKSFYYPLDILDLMLNFLPLGEKENHFLIELPALASQVASTNGTISFHFTLFNLRRAPVEMIHCVTLVTFWSRPSPPNPPNFFFFTLL